MNFFSRVVIISSISGRTPRPTVGPYCVSKHAVEAYADVIRYFNGFDQIITVLWQTRINWFQCLRAFIGAWLLHHKHYTNRYKWFGRGLGTTRRRNKEGVWKRVLWWLWVVFKILNEICIFDFQTRIPDSLVYPTALMI